MTQVSAPPSTAGTPLVPFSRVSTFIRQITHDVRNNLNAIDLQTAFVLELITDPEALEEVRRIRQLLQQSAKQLQALSANFWTAQPNLISYSAKIFVEDLHDRLAKQHPEQMSQVEWNSELGEEIISIDIEMIFAAVSEIFKNAFQFREEGKSLAAYAYSEGERLVFELCEGKSSVPASPERWGVEPFVFTRRGAYGLGLFRARGILAAHGGELAIAHDVERAILRTRVLLPLG